MDLMKLRNESDIRGIAVEGIEGQHVNLTDEAIYELSCGYITWLRNRLGKDDLRVILSLNQPFLCHLIPFSFFYTGIKKCPLALTR